MSRDEPMAGSCTWVGLAMARVAVGGVRRLQAASGLACEHGRLPPVADCSGKQLRAIVAPAIVLLARLRVRSLEA